MNSIYKTMSLNKYIFPPRYFILKNVEIYVKAIINHTLKEKA